jgi:Ni,Fe-hydrogenase III component G
MKLDEVAEDLRAKFGERILNVYKKSDRRLYVDVDTKAIVPVAGYVFKDLDARFMIASGIDTPRGVVEILYHFAFDRDDCVVSLRVMIDKENLEIESITSTVPPVEWIEREMWELLGINFRNHPDLRHLLLVDDWPEGNYPLRRDQ